jgi:hypothetical protein
MSRLIYVFFTISSTCAAWGQIKFHDPEGGIYLSHVDSLICTEQVVSTPAGEIKFKHCKHKLLKNAGRMLFSYQLITYPFDLSNTTDEPDLILEMMEESIAGSAETVFGEVVYKDFTDYSGKPSCFWRISYDKGKGVIRSRAIIKEDKMLIIKVDYPITLAGLPEIERFLQSIYLE